MATRFEVRIICACSERCLVHVVRVSQAATPAPKPSPLAGPGHGRSAPGPSFHRCPVLAARLQRPTPEVAIARAPGGTPALVWRSPSGSLRARRASAGRSLPAIRFSTPRRYDCLFCSELGLQILESAASMRYDMRSLPQTIKVSVLIVRQQEFAAKLAARS
jgi:hypothetical protein